MNYLYFIIRHATVAVKQWVRAILLSRNQWLRGLNLSRLQVAIAIAKKRSDQMATPHDNLLCSRLSGVHQLGEARSVMDSHFGEHFAIDVNAACFQTAHEAGIGHAI